MKCIVTGGNGFIGSHLVDKLIKEGNNVTVIDNLSAECNEEFYFNEKAENHKLDICDYESIEPLFHSADCVFHLAAESTIEYKLFNKAIADNSTFRNAQPYSNKQNPIHVQKNRGHFLLRNSLRGPGPRPSHEPSTANRPHRPGPWPWPMGPWCRPGSKGPMVLALGPNGPHMIHKCQ